MQNTELLDMFQQLGVVSNGHFVLSSGRHSNEYWEKFRLLEWPRVTERLCGQIASRHKQSRIEAVIGPTTGGALLAQEVARQLNARCLLSELTSVGGRELRRGFVLHTSERVLVVDDVLTTGLSLRETLSALDRFQPEIVGIELLIDRSGGDAIAQFRMSCHALLTVLAQTYSSEECPMCKEGIPIVKPGTRDI